MDEKIQINLNSSAFKSLFFIRILIYSNLLIIELGENWNMFFYYIFDDNSQLY